MIKCNSRTNARYEMQQLMLANYLLSSITEVLSMVI